MSLRKLPGGGLDRLIRKILPSEEDASTLGLIRRMRAARTRGYLTAFELEALPLPSPDAIVELTCLVDQRAPIAKIEAECRRLYGVEK